LEEDRLEQRGGFERKGEGNGKMIPTPTRIRTLAFLTQSFWALFH
jgi:hypothetical protein